MVRKQSRSGQQTRERIIDAALETVRTEGLIGTSARAIARTGGFNQALVFYHFGSVDDLLLSALERANDRRIERFRPKLAEVADLRALVAVAVELQASTNDPDEVALSGIVAGWCGKAELMPRIREILQPWDDMVAEALDRSIAHTAIGSLIPTGDLAHAISALFLGMQLMRRFQGDDERARSLLVALSTLAELAEPMLGALEAGPEGHPPHGRLAGPAATTG